MTKHCTKCKQDKPLCDFSRSQQQLGKSRCRPCLSAYSREWAAGHREYSRGATKEYQRKVRMEMLIAYGGKCACCGETEEKFLALDHVNGGGSAHKRNAGGGPISAIVKREGYPKDGRYQLLCHNCNSAKGFYGACPHTQTIVGPPAAYTVADQNWFIQ